jgi:hypothetical protein
MKSNIRHTFRPNLEALEGRLVPSFSWGLTSSPDFAAVLSSFQWGVGRGIGAQAAVGWDIGKHLPTAAQPAAVSPPAVGLMMPPAATEIVVTKMTDDIVLRRVRDVTTQTGPTTVVTAAPSTALPTESISLNFTKVE